MYTNKLVFLGFILWIIPVIVFAQNSTNSPYTRYGYGALADKAFISQRGMGGIGYGLRNSQLINPMNPASFSSVDSMTFMFDVGVTSQVSWLKDELNKERKINGNLEYIAMQFPIAKGLGVGAGFEPVSYVGYNFMDSENLLIDDKKAYYIYTGTGGLSKVYGVISYDLFNRVSLGAKLSYLFGDIMHDKMVTFYSLEYNTNWTDTVRANGLLYDFALQYHLPIGKFKSITVGAVYSPKIRIGSQVMSDTIQSDPSSGMIMSVSRSVSNDLGFEFPETFGLGFTYNRLGKLTVGADVLYQKWSEVKYYDQTNTFNNRLKFNAGGEFIPNYTSTNYFQKVRYRGGLYFTNSYIKVKDSKYNEYGVNLGIGFPTPDRRSFINLAFEYSLVRPEVKTLIDEQYFKVSLSYTFNELWFFKRKVQ